MRSRALLAAGVSLGLAMAVVPVEAAGWRFVAGEAGLWVDGGLNGLAVGCGPQGLSLSVFGFPARLETGTLHSVVVTIDGTARRFRARAGQRPGAPGSALTATLSGFEAESLVDALRRGRTAEVATPAGRYELPLSGSAKALDALGQSPGCPG
ncbi:hypothetical protein ATO4_18899 [Aurantimonas sp. 22II-16-19i]|nr:hypothetical protein ATO4_18899 [Aurantimonas sp. 22II-16-19i]